MIILKCNKRDDSVKIKALRRSGMGPAVIYGKNLKESVKIQASNIELSKLVKSTSIGSLVTVDVDGELYPTMLKQVDYMPMSTIVQHIDFQVLTTGEKINSSAPVLLLNRDSVSVEAIVQESLTAIDYSSLPVDLVDHFEVDLSTISIGDSIQLEDLPVYTDEKYHFITPGHSTIVSLIYAKRTEETDTDDEEEITTEVE